MSDEGGGHAAGSSKDAEGYDSNKSADQYEGSKNVHFLSSIREIAPFTVNGPPIPNDRDYSNESGSSKTNSKIGQRLVAAPRLVIFI